MIALKNINVALVGCGYVSNSHLRAWSRIPYAKIVAVCDNNVKAVDKVAREWKIERRFTSVSEISSLKDITLWDICTPINTHKDLAIRAMKDGFNVLIEKPLTISSQDAKEIVDCQRTTNRKAGVIHNWLFEPPVLKAKDCLRRGRIGEVISAQIDVLHTKDDPMTANKDHWSHQLPGGRFSEMLIHPIYLMREFIGDIEVENVAVSKLGEYEWMKHDELFATFKAQEKLAGTHVSFNAPRNSINISLFGRSGILKLDIITATLNVLPQLGLGRVGKGADSARQAFQLLSSTTKNVLTVLSGKWFDGHEMCIRKFAESLVEDKEPPVTVKEGYEVVKVLESLYRRL